MAPRLVDIKTTQGEQKITTIRGEPIQVGERIGEPVLISTIEKGSKVISRNYTGKQKDMLVECFQRIMLLAMENKRLVARNNILEQNNSRLNTTIQELNIKVRSIHTFESEIHRLQQERDEFERRINTYLTERSSLILEIEKLKSMESKSFLELESKLRLLVTENERITGMLQTAQNDSQEVHSLKLKL
jgi:predicted RNase H-like nuclease (RuvC/YqgF family)